MEKIVIALKYVQTFCPEVVGVAFDLHGRWFYFEDMFEAPDFPDEIDVEILENASDEASNIKLPFIYIDEEAYMARQ